MKQWKICYVNKTNRNKFADDDKRYLINVQVMLFTHFKYQQANYIVNENLSQFCKFELQIFSCDQTYDDTLSVCYCYITNVNHVSIAFTLYFSILC